MKRIAMLVGVASLVLVGCDPGQPSGSQASGSQVSGFAAPLSNSEYNSLTAEQQYQVVNKLAATVYKGVPVHEFFDVSAGFANPRVQMTDGLSRLKAALTTDLTAEQLAEVDKQIDGHDAEGNPTEELALYQFDEDRPRSLPLARMFEYPVSRDVFVAWMAYFMANTIMFSPALEMESTDIVNVQNTYRRLARGIGAGNSIRQIIRGHMPTIDRWRVSRSAENHALEAYELYLGLFDTEEDSRRGGMACKDFYLTDADDGYQLVQTDFPNTDPQLILNDLYEVTNCDDFHDVIAGHPLLIPRVAEVIINYLMDGHPLSDRQAMAQSIVAAGAETFEDMFTAIIFSREYLLNTERTKSFEENLMPLLHTLRWDVRIGAGTLDDGVFNDLTSNNNSDIYLGGMGWDSMSLKIGRYPFVPMDAQSFGNYHRAIRQAVLRVTNNYTGRQVTVQQQDPNTGDMEDVDIVVDSLTRGNDGNGGVVLLDHLNDITPENYLHFLFLSAAQRRAHPVELTDLLALFGPNDLNLIRDRDNDGDMDITVTGNVDTTVARETFDYLSRLPEFYYFKAIN